MAVSFDSFDESPLGVFIESPLGVRDSAEGVGAGVLWVLRTRGGSSDFYSISQVDFSCFREYDTVGQSIVAIGGTRRTIWMAVRTLPPAYLQKHDARDGFLILRRTRATAGIFLNLGDDLGETWLKFGKPTGGSGHTGIGGSDEQVWYGFVVTREGDAGGVAISTYYVGLDGNLRRNTPAAHTSVDNQPGKIGGSTSKFYAVANLNTLERWDDTPFFRDFFESPLFRTFGIGGDENKFWIVADNQQIAELDVVEDAVWFALRRIETTTFQFRDIGGSVS